MNMPENSKRVAFGGVMTALGTIIIIMSAVLQLAIFILPAVSGMIVLLSAFEVDYKFSIKVYFSISVLSLMFSPDKSAAILFIILLGYYPLLKFKIDYTGKKLKFLKTILKLLIFNFVVILYYYVWVYLFSVPEEALTLFGVYMPGVLLIVGNLTFLMYDRCIFQISVLFLCKFKNQVPFNKIKWFN